MAQTIKNLKELSKALEPKIKATLELIAEDVKKEIDETLDEYYSEYLPIYYSRTEQMRDCCKIGKTKINGNRISIDVYLDVDSLNYRTKGADPYKSLVSANSGLHGGLDPSNTSVGQVPWDVISSNDGSRHGSGTQIWEEPMEELIDNGKLVELFKKHARARGLNIK